MDRAIKFRVWSLKNKCWCYPVLDITNDFNIKNKDSEYQYVFMQFTGLYDCEGKEIYEHDVVKYQGGDVESGIAIVNRVEGGFIFKWITQETSSPSLFSPCIYFLCKEELTILGNIYEHPNLLNNESNT